MTLYGAMPMIAAFVLGIAASGLASALWVTIVTKRRSRSLDQAIEMSEQRLAEIVRIETRRRV
jgi:hypothetical protein